MAQRREIISEEAMALAVRMTLNRAFKDRKGHGGEPCTKRVLTPKQIESMAWYAIRRAIDAERYCLHKKHPAINRGD